jgi:hypothetical protein
MRATTFAVASLFPVCMWLAVAPVGAQDVRQRCGMDDCPVGFKNLFCRSFTPKTSMASNSEDGNNDAEYDFQLCIVNKGGPINVAGDLTFFFKVLKNPEEKNITATVHATVVNKHVMGNPITYSDNFAFGPTKTVKPSKPADWYILAPQLSAAEQTAFRSDFAAAVDIDVSIEIYQDSSKANKVDCGDGKSDWCSFSDIVPAPKGQDTKHLYDGIREMNRR